MPADENRQHLFKFEWFVDPDGYTLDDHDYTIVANGKTLRSYRPFIDTPSIHRVMASLPTTEKGAIDFANQFGLLGWGFAFWGTPYEEREETDLTIKEQGYEEFDHFEITSDLTKRLAFLIDEKPRRWRSDVVDEINRAEMGLTLVMTNEADRPSYSFAPQSLRDYIILMFAEEVTERRSVKKCKQCGNWFLVGPSPRGAAARGGVRLRRSDSETCSDRCRVQFNRKKKKK